MNIESAFVCYLYGVGAWGPGFANWQDLQRQLLNAADIPADLALVPPKAEVIPANERRRAPPIVKAAVEVSTLACQQAQIDPRELACVFGSGLGDTEITDYLCSQLAAPEKQLSPTKFHNSVHNAPAGYWTIATHCMRSANSIAAYQHTAGVSLIEAVLQAHQDNSAVLVTLFDLAARGLYQQIYAADQDFAAALVIAPQRLVAAPLAKLTLTLESEPLPTPPWALSFERLHSTNPAAGVLPILYALATVDASTTVSLTLSDDSSLKILVDK